MTTLLELTKKLHNTLALYNGAGHALGWKTEKVDKLLDESKRVIELAEQSAQQEPVAWLVCDNWRKHSLFFTEEGAEDFKNAAQREDDLSGNLARWKAKPLYTSSQAERPWVGLTDDDKCVKELYESDTDPEWIDGYTAGLKDAENKLRRYNAQPALVVEQLNPVAKIEITRSKHTGEVDGWAFVERPRNAPAGIYSVYTSPPAQRKPLTDEWVPVTQSLLNEQHPWFYQPMWIAMKDGAVLQGHYEWRQGWNPDRFIADGFDHWAFDADYVMPVIKPTPPTIKAAHGIKENT